MNELRIIDIGDNLGGNRLILNGRELEGVTSYSLEAGVGIITKLTLELAIDNMVSSFPLSDNPEFEIKNLKREISRADLLDL